MSLLDGPSGLIISAPRESVEGWVDGDPEECGRQARVCVCSSSIDFGLCLASKSQTRVCATWEDPMRSIWKGHIRFLLVAIPIRVYNALEASERIQFNQLH